MIFGFTKTELIKILNPGEIQGFFMSIRNHNCSAQIVYIISPEFSKANHEKNIN